MSEVHGTQCAQSNRTDNKRRLAKPIGETTIDSSHLSTALQGGSTWQTSRNKGALGGEDPKLLINMANERN